MVTTIRLMRIIGVRPTTVFLATFRSLLQDETFRVAVSFLGAMIAAGTVVYSFVEGWTLLDSLYFSVITAATVGYGDFHPVTDIGKLYTIVYVLVTTGLLVFVLSRVAAGMIVRSQGRPRTPGDEPDEPG